MFDVAQSFGVAAQAGLELDCGMGDIEPVFQGPFYFIQNRFDLVHFLIVNQGMGAEGNNI